MQAQFYRQRDTQHTLLNSTTEDGRKVKFTYLGNAPSGGAHEAMHEQMDDQEISCIKVLHSFQGDYSR
jgi:hypothetical protein